MERMLKCISPLLSANRWGRLGFLLPVAFVSLASIHLCQSIVFSGGARIPGYMGDSRFVNLLLEHNYQSLTGEASLASPSQFHPVENTLYLASNLFGTTPIYCFPRLLGISMETSYQIWFLVVASLNAFAMLFLLRRLGVRRSIGYPLGFAAISSSALAFKLIHPQLLAIFPFLFAWAFLHRFLESPNVRSFAAVLLLWAYQHYCDVYQGVFATVLLTLIACFQLLFSGKPKALATLGFFYKNKGKSTVAVGLALLLLTILYLPYTETTGTYDSRSMEYLTELAPRLGSWFNPSPYSYFYSGQHLLFFDRSRPHEHVLFSGWTPWVLTLVGVVLCIRKVKMGSGPAPALFATVVVTFALTTTWWEPSANAWIALVKLLDPLRAIRVISRVGYLVFAIQCVACCLLLQAFLKPKKPNSFRVFSLTALAWFAGFESLALGQRSFDKAESRSRATSLAASLDQSPNVKAFAFCPGDTNQPMENVHLDAWHAALLTGIPCLNGYSGHFPPSHAPFIFHPTKQQALALTQRLGYPLHEIAFIEGWGAAIEKSLSIRKIHFALDARLAINSTMTEIQGVSGERKTIPVRIRCNWTTAIPCRPLQLFASYKLYLPNGKLLPNYIPLRTPINLLPANSNTACNLQMRLPDAPGTYEARLTFVHELVAWGTDLGLPYESLRMTVK